MKRNLILASIFALAAFAASADTKVTIAADSTWHPPVPVNTPQWMACSAKAHGNWNQSVCHQAKKNLRAAKKPITFESLKAEMASVDAQDQTRFDQKIEEERQRRHRQIQKNSL